MQANDLIQQLRQVKGSDNITQFQNVQSIESLVTSLYTPVFTSWHHIDLKFERLDYCNQFAQSIRQPGGSEALYSSH